MRTFMLYITKARNGFLLVEALILLQIVCLIVMLVTSGVQSYYRTFQITYEENDEFFIQK